MSTIDTPEPDSQAVAPDAAAPTIVIRTLHRADEMEDVADVFQQVWGSVTEIVPLEMLMAISHAGGYVAAAYDVGRADAGERIVGASVGLLARHQGTEALHSHVTGILPGVRSSGLGRQMKLHQQDWARDRGIDWIVWTFDPLVRRNAWFNIAVLGAEVHDYLPEFYGEMNDAINAGDQSDRLLMAWSVAIDPDAPTRDGSDLDLAAVEHVPTPDDIVTLRRMDLDAVRRWRLDTRERLMAAIESGRPVVGFTRDGDYLIGDPS